MRVIDILLAFPWLLLAIGIVAILGPGINNVVIAVAIVYIPAFARIVRGSVLSIKEKEYVEAARAMGQPTSRIITRHVLANAWAPIIVLATLSIGQAIIYAAGLSFIGLGTQPPDADWGVMLTSGREYLRDAPGSDSSPGWPSSLRCWRSTCLATGCGTRSIPGCGERRGNCWARLREMWQACTAYASIVAVAATTFDGRTARWPRYRLR